MMAAWQHAWREGFGPTLTTPALVALAQALEADDPGLMQDATTFPPPLQALAGHQVRRACAVCYGGWKGEGLKTVGQVEAYFFDVCRRAGERLGDLEGICHLLNWWDSTPRPTARRELLAEVLVELACRPEWRPAA